MTPKPSAYPLSPPPIYLFGAEAAYTGRVRDARVARLRSDHRKCGYEHIDGMYWARGDINYDETVDVDVGQDTSMNAFAVCEGRGDRCVWLF